MRLRDVRVPLPIFAPPRRDQTAFAFADTGGRWPYAEELTTNLVYCRLHGDPQLYVSGQRLESWAGCDVFVYFDNDAKVHAPFDAQRLGVRLA